jgi:hypothetical protein
MDSGLTIRPVSAASPRQDAGPVRGTVPTNLGPAQSVTAPAKPTEVRAEDPYTRKIILDAQSREVIDRSVNAGPRRVVRQMPEVAARRLKAYTRYAKDRTGPHDPQADIEV